jgi:hypothetical protein
LGGRFAGQFMSGVWKLFAFDKIIRRHARLYAGHPRS